MAAPHSVTDMSLWAKRHAVLTGEEDSYLILDSNQMCEHIVDVGGIL